MKFYPRTDNLILNSRLLVKQELLTKALEIARKYFYIYNEPFINKL